MSKLRKNGKKNPGVAAAIEAANGQHRLAELLGVSQATVFHYLYFNVPAERATEIEKKTGVPRSRIRPDLFPPEAAP